MAAAAQQRMILWTFALVLFLGAVGATFMLQPPPKMARAARTTVIDSRNPASVPMTLHELAGNTEASALDLTLPCEKSGAKANSKSVLDETVRQIRLSGENCLPTDEIASTEIRNESNGFSATVFQPTAKSFTTDYITLAKGPNRLRILHIYKRGARVEREYVIERPNQN